VPSLQAVISIFFHKKKNIALGEGYWAFTLFYILFIITTQVEAIDSGTQVHRLNGNRGQFVSERTCVFGFGAFWRSVVCKRQKSTYWYWPTTVRTGSKDKKREDNVPRADSQAAC
jgi:hypothetical protein